MTQKIQVRRGTEAERLQTVLDVGEPGFTTDTKKFFVGDGVTAGGIPITGDATQITESPFEDVGTNPCWNIYLTGLPTAGTKLRVKIGASSYVEYIETHPNPDPTQGQWDGSGAGANPNPVLNAVSNLIDAINNDTRVSKGDWQAVGGAANSFIFFWNDAGACTPYNGASMITVSGDATNGLKVGAYSRVGASSTNYGRTAAKRRIYVNRYIVNTVDVGRAIEIHMPSLTPTMVIVQLMTSDDDLVAFTGTVLNTGNGLRITDTYSQFVNGYHLNILAFE